MLENSHIKSSQDPAVDFCPEERVTPHSNVDRLYNLQIKYTPILQKHTSEHSDPQAQGLSTSPFPQP